MRRSRSSAPPDDSDSPSKSQLKRESHALQVLGARLVELSDERLLKLPLEDRLIDAVRLARTIRAREGLRRQVQYIGRLMRESNAQAIQLALDGDHTRHRMETALMHSAERWRERLISESDAIAQWLALHPLTEEALRPLVTKARSETASAQHGRHYRELFRLLRDTLVEASIASESSSTSGVRAASDPPEE